MIVCGSGHRKVFGDYPDDDVFRALIQFCRVPLEALQPERVLSGMALGWDLAIARAALLEGIPLTVCLPHEDQCGRWPKHMRRVWREIVEEADQSVLVWKEPGYESWGIDGIGYVHSLRKRNDYMVDHSDTVVAYWDGENKGGTAHCLEYARASDKKILNGYSGFRAYWNYGLWLI